MVFLDHDGSGTRGEFDIGLLGHTVYLDLDNSGTFSPGDRVTSTDYDGRYFFGNLDGGTYTVRQVLRPDDRWAQTTPAGGAGRTVTLAAGQQASNQDFGTAVAGELRGYVWNDRDADGFREPWFGTGVGGAVVYLDLDNDAAPDPGEPSVETLHGSYFFRDVTPGTYRVRVVVPGGWAATTPAVREMALSHRSYVEGDFGLRAAPGVVGRRVFYNNSAFDGRTPIGDYRATMRQSPPTRSRCARASVRRSPTACLTAVD